MVLEPEDIPDPDTDDSVIEILTDQMIDFDENNKDALKNYAVTGGSKKRVDVNDRKMSEEDKKLFRRAKEAELQSWLDHTVFDAAIE